MRFALILAALLVSCTDVDRATPTIQTLARLDGTAAAESDFAVTRRAY